MLQSVFKKVVGSRNDRLVKQYLQKVKANNALEPAMEKLSDAELAGKTAEFKSRLENGETFDKLLPEAFAVVRETSRRVLGMRHFDVQMVGGMAIFTSWGPGSAVPTCSTCSPAPAPSA